MTKNYEDRMFSANLEKMSINNNLYFTKSYNFNKTVVYKAFTQAKYLQKWFGTLESKVTVCELDLQIGGKLTLELESIQGKRTFVGEYLEILENEKLIFSLHGIDNGQIFVESLNTILFNEPEPGKTNLSVNVEVNKLDKEIGGSAIEGTKKGWTDGLEKLVEILNEIISN